MGINTLVMEPMDPEMVSWQREHVSEHQREQDTRSMQYSYVASSTLCSTAHCYAWLLDVVLTMHPYSSHGMTPRSWHGS
jgi:hypothetical protein